MRFKILAIPLAACLFFGCGNKDSKHDDTPPPEKRGKMELTSDKIDQLLGKWGPFESPFIDNSTGKQIGVARSSLKVGNGTVSVIVSCEFNNGVTVGPLEVTSAANMSDSEIEVLEEKKVSKTVDGSNCFASLTRVKVAYKLKENTIALTLENGQSMTLTKMKEAYPSMSAAHDNQN